MPAVQALGGQGAEEAAQGGAGQGEQGRVGADRPALGALQVQVSGLGQQLPHAEGHGGAHHRHVAVT